MEYTLVAYSVLVAILLVVFNDVRSRTDKMDKCFENLPITYEEKIRELKKLRKSLLDMFGLQTFLAILISSLFTPPSVKILREVAEFYSCVGIDIGSFDIGKGSVLVVSLFSYVFTIKMLLKLCSYVVMYRRASK